MSGDQSAATAETTSEKNIFNSNNNNSSNDEKDNDYSGTVNESASQSSVDCSTRSRGELFLGKLLIILTIISFIFVGLLLNILQLLLTCTIKLSQARRWRNLHKRLNGYLVYAIFAQPIFVLYSWSKMKLSVVLDDVKLIEDVQRDMLGVIIANHTFELDWMTCFIMADQLGNIGSYKCFAKDELKYLPIIGWSFWMSDLIYVKRDWQQDKLNIDKSLDELLAYDQILLGIFAEGTRWTEEKHLDAVKFAKSRNIEPFKHHLFPRQRGFNYTIRHYLRRQALEPESMQGKQVRVFNLEIVMPDKLKFCDFLEGRQVRADIYVAEVQLSAKLRTEAINSRNEDECVELTHLLRNIFREKDKLLDEYELNGHEFRLDTRPSGGHYPIKWPIKPLVYWLAGMSVTYGTFTYMALTLFAGSPTFWLCVVLILTSGMLLLKRIERESKPTKLRLKTKLM